MSTLKHHVTWSNDLLAEQKCWFKAFNYFLTAWKPTDIDSSCGLKLINLRRIWENLWTLCWSHINSHKFLPSRKIKFSHKFRTLPAQSFLIMVCLYFFPTYSRCYLRVQKRCLTIAVLRALFHIAKVWIWTFYIKQVFDWRCRHLLEWEPELHLPIPQIIQINQKSLDLSLGHLLFIGLR